ncbi:MAG: S1C family serine protease [Anaerolineae bacterium]
MNTKNSSVWIIVGIVCALLLGCILGSCAGGFVGYGLARRIVSNRINPILPNPTGISRTPLQRGEGVVITSVVAGSPAEQAGITAGDTIIALNGQVLTARQTLSRLVEQFQPGDTVTLTILRGYQKFDLQVTLGSDQALSGSRAWLGIYYNQ